MVLDFKNHVRLRNRQSGSECTDLASYIYHALANI